MPMLKEIRIAMMAKMRAFSSPPQCPKKEMTKRTPKRQI
jgi:hypothetical protein